MPSLESKHPLLITAAKVTIKLETTKKFLHFLEIEITIGTEILQKVPLKMVYFRLRRRS